MEAESSFRNVHQHLIEGCRTNDSECQLQLYRIYYRSMYNTAVRMLHHTAEAEDCMQEAFLKAFTRIDSYQNEVSFGSWLKRIVVNTCLDELRKRKLEFAETDKLPEAAEDPFDFDCGSEMTADCIKRCIGELPDNYRVIISLFLLEGYDHEEIAEILHITNAASRTLLHRAKQKLAALVKEKQKISI